MSLERRLATICLLFCAVVAVGGIGYTLIEGWTLIDSLYMAIITVTTVGYAEVHPLTREAGYSPPCSSSSVWAALPTRSVPWRIMSLPVRCEGSWRRAG